MVETRLTNYEKLIEEERQEKTVEETKAQIADIQEKQAKQAPQLPMNKVKSKASRGKVFNEYRSSTAVQYQSWNTGYQLDLPEDLKKMQN